MMTSYLLPSIQYLMLLHVAVTPLLQILASISSAIMDQFVSRGDMNGKIKDRQVMVGHNDNMTHVTCGDDNNSNGELLQGTCMDFNLVLLNNLKYKLKHI